MSRLRAMLQHVCNELHICCRLRDLGLSPGLSARIGRRIGGWLKPIVYRRTR